MMLLLTQWRRSSELIFEPTRRHGNGTVAVQNGVYFCEVSCEGVAGPLRAPWLRPKQTELVPGKGQFRSRFPSRLSYGCPTTIFLDPQPTPTSSQRNTSGRAGWKRLGPVVTMRSRSLGRWVFECWL